MRAIALRTKTALAVLAGAGVLALGTATVPAAGAQDALAHLTSVLSGGHTSVLADDRTPSVIHP
ncbi:hypothetical protein KUM39_11690 [Streptomyces sp. J2-1]|uniref:hypothetical protein n=1 Tax=Streptomyces corallincola TaxID=2851888 RepID=UPI001C38424F|nr:hypothetical protein [Streptomyces corallincola]MBV2355020.1 hypothetical protein [Streptomyces corallincola]